MTNSLLYITWDVNPEIFNFGGFAVRWYGLLFALAFYFGYYVLAKVFKTEGKPIEMLDALVLYALLGIVLGARLGHVIFYDLDFYLKNPEEIIKIWHGGLASHGAALGLLVALFFYQRKYPDISFVWILDRISLPVAAGATFVRIGNLFNSEIVGKPTELPWGFIFVRNGENFPRHPSQLYEAFAYFIVFLVLVFLYKKYKQNIRPGTLIGTLLIGIFGFRFFVEFLKEVQSPFEENLPLDMGQILSIPLVLLGFYFLFFYGKSKKNPR